MRVFKKFNQSNAAKCPICQTNEEKETVLIGIQGTENGGNIQANQYHLDCIELIEQKISGHTIISQVIDQSF